MQLQLVDVWHRYGQQDVLRGLSVSLDAGEIGCLLGPSGCGKTTALRCIAGFEPVTAGEIQVDGAILSRAGFTELPERRQIGMVFQDAALLPHLSALENVAFGLHALPPDERRRRAEELLEVVGLREAASRYAHQLSGGQQQRVAVARALAPKPRLVLLDEPFANLDSGLRERLGREVREILLAQGVTALLVTHDQSEAFSLADRIAVLRDGTVAQWGSAYEIYHRPVDRYVADFVGRGVVLPARVIDANSVAVGGTVVEGAVPDAFCSGDHAGLLLRPDDVVEDQSGLPARVVHRSFLGPTIVYTLAFADGTELLASLPAHRDHAHDALVSVALRPPHLVLFRD